MAEHPSVLALWRKYLESIGEDVENTEKTYTSWHFDVAEDSANSLLHLVLIGSKRGTASLPWTFEFDGQPLPTVGEYSVITDWDGVAHCVIQTTGLQTIPFNKVPEAFARKEGEGDLSLAYWRKVHQQFFQGECARIRREFTEDIPVLCEEFELIYSEKPQ